MQGIELEVEQVQEIIIMLKNGEVKKFTQGAFLEINEVTEEVADIKHYYCSKNSFSANECLDSIIFKQSIRH